MGQNLLDSFHETSWKYIKLQRHEAPYTTGEALEVYLQVFNMKCCSYATDIPSVQCESCEGSI